MTTTSLTNPKASRFGWPLASRREEFQRLKAEPGLPTDRVVFQGKAQDFPIIRVPINLPKYRLENGRTASVQKEYLARNKDKGEDFFTKDPELLEVQEIQHELLHHLVRKQRELLDHFKDSANRQVNPILLDEFGFVINGNRRLSTWRDLYHEDSSKYAHFSHIDVVVLPHCDDKEIDRLEAALQILPDIRADYTWDTEANMMLQKQLLHAFTTRELADLYGKKESEIKELIEMRNCAAEYLRSRGKEDHWSDVSKDEYAFRELVRNRSKIVSLGEQELFQEAAYVLIDNPEPVGGRLYQTIPSVGEYLDRIKEKLQEKFNVAPAAPNNAIDDFFGGMPKPAAIDIPLAAEIRKPENGDAVREIITDVIESQKELKKDAKTAAYLRNTIAKANAAMTTAVSEGLRPESSREGVEAQLQALEQHIQRIRAWLNEYA